MAVLQQLRQGFAVTETAIDQAFVKAFQLMGQVTDGVDVGHPRTTLEGVQVTLQGQQRRGVVRVAQPALQGLAGAVEDIHRLFEEDRDDLIVQPDTAPCRSWLASEGR
ncbi:hypothetical protein D3C86_2025710 [compost metagenome]